MLRALIYNIVLIVFMNDKKKLEKDELMKKLHKNDQYSTILS